MADDFDYDLDGFDDDDAWLYVDDEFDLADELAEGQVPEPGYAGNNAEIDNDFYDYEFYHYWDDLEYGDDAYWDVGPSAANDDKASVKRKRSESGKKETLVDKRRRTDSSRYEGFTREQDPLVFCSRAERIHPRKPDLLQKGTAAFSLLPDWRKRLAKEDGSVNGKEMPLDMKRAAEATTPQASEEIGKAGDHAYSEILEEDDQEDWGDNEEEDGEEGALSLDLTMLKEILKEKLGDAGLNDMDEDAFMQTIAKMLSSGNDADDAAGELANSVLGKLASDSDAGEGAALSGWLSQQGVTLEDADDDDASSVATVELQASQRRATGESQEAVPDKTCAAKGATKCRSASSGRPLHATSSTTIPMKRTAGTIAMGENPSKRNKRVTFDVPSSDPAAFPTAPADSVLTSEDPLMSAPTLASQGATIGRSSTKHSARGNKKVAGQPAAVQLPENKPTIASRKRKAAATSTEAGPVEGNLDDEPPEKRNRSSTRAEAGQRQTGRPDTADGSGMQILAASGTRSSRARAVNKGNMINE